MSDADDLARTGAPTIDAAHFKAVVGHFASGIVIVTGMDGDEPVGLTCQTFLSLSLEPPLVAFSPSRTSKSWPRIEGSGAFCVNVLSDEQEDVCRLFAQSGADKFKGVGWKPAASGSPRLADCLAWIDCHIDTIHEAGDHLIVVGRVVEIEHTAAHPIRPLLFFRGGYGSFES
jgi:3-hydroxy-9,10-secoandrosta-1,3,5(10)-triene-9,17-dione monooxygenase reductase component